MSVAIFVFRFFIFPAVSKKNIKNNEKWTKLGNFKFFVENFLAIFAEFQPFLRYSQFFKFAFYSLKNRKKVHVYFKKPRQCGPKRPSCSPTCPTSRPAACLRTPSPVLHPRLSSPRALKSIKILKKNSQKSETFSEKVKCSSFLKKIDEDRSKLKKISNKIDKKLQNIQNGQKR